MVGTVVVVDLMEVVVVNLVVVYNGCGTGGTRYAINCGCGGGNGLMVIVVLVGY